jgi:hypothetical protein
MMTNNPWIELKRTEFLSALKEIKPSFRVRGAPERELQIGLVNSQVVFSVQGASVSRPAVGDWQGLASLRLAFFLTFLVAKPAESMVRISFVDGKIHASSARFPAKWVDSNDLLTVTHLNDHAKTPTKEETLKFKCPKCRRKQGVAFFSISQGPFMTDMVREMVTTGESFDHGFGCLSCGKTWATQSL